MFKDIKEMESKYQVLFSLLIAFAVISFWRGIWGLMDEYLVPTNRPLSFALSVVIGVVILILTNYATKELM